MPYLSDASAEVTERLEAADPSGKVLAGIKPKKEATRSVDSHMAITPTAPLAFMAIRTLPQPTAFSALV